MYNLKLKSHKLITIDSHKLLLLLPESSKESSKDDSGPSKSTTAADQIQPEADLLPRSTVERVLREFGLPVSTCCIVAVRLLQNLHSARVFWVGKVFVESMTMRAPQLNSIHCHIFQVRFFGESDDEACERLREEERLRGGGGGGNQQGQVRNIDT